MQLRDDRQWDDEDDEVGEDTNASLPNADSQPYVDTLVQPRRIQGPVIWLAYGSEVYGRPECKKEVREENSVAKISQPSLDAKDADVDDENRRFGAVCTEDGYE